MRNFRVALFAAYAIFITGECSSDEIDIDDVLAAKLAVKQNFPINPMTKSWFRFSGLRISPKSIIYSNLKEGAIPNRVIKKTFIYSNCTDQKFTQSKKETVSYELSTTINLKSQIISSESISSGWNLTFGNSAFKEGFSGDRKESITIDVTKTDASSSKTTETEEISGVIEQLPNTITAVVFEKKLRTDFIDFDGLVIIDGVVLSYTGPTCGPNGKCVAPPSMKLRDMLSEDERTVELKGSIWNVAAEDSKTSYHTYPVSNYPKYCPDLVEISK